MDPIVALHLFTEAVLALAPLFAAIAACIAAYGSMIGSRQAKINGELSRLNTQKIQEVHVLVNSEMQKFRDLIMAEKRQAVSAAFKDGAELQRVQNDTLQTSADHVLAVAVAFKEGSEAERERLAAEKAAATPA